MLKQQGLFVRTTIFTQKRNICHTILGRASRKVRHNKHRQNLTKFDKPKSYIGLRRVFFFHTRAQTSALATIVKVKVC